MVEDARASYVTFYKKDGSTLDWSIKSILGGDGYQMDVSVSPDGTQVMVSYAYLKNGGISSKVVFYNFSEVGKNYLSLIHISSGGRRSRWRAGCGGFSRRWPWRWRRSRARRGRA